MSTKESADTSPASTTAQPDTNDVEQAPDYNEGTSWEDGDFSSLEITGLPELEDGETSYKGIPSIQEWLPHAPDYVRKNIKNMQGLMTRRAQEAAELKREIAAIREQLIGKDQRVFKELDNLEKHMPVIRTQEQLDEVMNSLGDNLWTEQGQRTYQQASSEYAKAQALQALRDVQAPIRAEYEQNQAIERAKQFIQSIPEMADVAVQKEVYELMKESQSSDGMSRLTLPEATEIILARRDKAAREQAAVEQRQANANTRSTVAKSTTGNRATTTVDFSGIKDEVELLHAVEQYYAEHGKAPPRRRKY